LRWPGCRCAAPRAPAASTARALPCRRVQLRNAAAMRAPLTAAVSAASQCSTCSPPPAPTVRACAVACSAPSLSRRAARLAAHASWCYVNHAVDVSHMITSNSTRTEHNCTESVADTDHHSCDGAVREGVGVGSQGVT
jgi:hypothetical protein